MYVRERSAFRGAMQLFIVSLVASAIALVSVTGFPQSPAGPWIAFIGTLGPLLISSWLFAQAFYLHRKGVEEKRILQGEMLKPFLNYINEREDGQVETTD
jgi:hypothetical protein